MDTNGGKKDGDSADDLLSKLCEALIVSKRFIYQQRAAKLAEEFRDFAEQTSLLARWLDAEGNEPDQEVIATIDELRSVMEPYGSRATRMHFLETLEESIPFGKAAATLKIYSKAFYGREPSDEERATLLATDDETLAFSFWWITYLGTIDKTTAEMWAGAAIVAQDAEQLKALMVILWFALRHPEYTDRMQVDIIRVALSAFAKGKGRHRKSKHDKHKWETLADVMDKIGMGRTERLEQDWHDWRRSNTSAFQEGARRRKNEASEYALACKEAAEEARKLIRGSRRKKKATRPM
jgi:hypothetical protein